MSRTFEVSENLILDSRRAAWFPRERALAIADLHLGYAWAHRAGGQLLPIAAKNDTVPRLLELYRQFDPAEIAILGDVVHRAIPVTAIEAEVRELFTTFSDQCRLTLIAGNHDRELAAMLSRWGIPIDLPRTRIIGDHVLLHGDKPLPETLRNHRAIMGHEHPAISIGDGVTTSQKCPCFLLSESVVILPAFSRWAAGTVFGAYPFSSQLAREAKFTRAVAICGSKLLPIRL